MYAPLQTHPRGNSAKPDKERLRTQQSSFQFLLLQLVTSGNLFDLSEPVSDEKTHFCVVNKPLLRQDTQVLSGLPAWAPTSGGDPVGPMI